MRFNTFLGVNNRSTDASLDRGDTGRYLRDAVNLDVTADGRLQGRTGYTEVIAGAYAHSIFSMGDDGLYVDSGVLYHLQPSAAGLVRTAVRSGLAPSALVSFVEAGGYVYYSNGSVLERYRDKGCQPAVIAAPSPAPVPTFVPDGALPEATYLLAFAMRDVAGEVGLASDVVAVTGVGAIEFTVPTMPTGTFMQAYITSANGSELMLAGEFLAGERRIDTPVTAGVSCPTLNRRAMPPGSIVRAYHGRLLVASGNLLFYSEPMQYGVAADLGFIPFPAPITLVEPCESGVFVAADRTYWLAGADIADVAVSTASLDTAVPGSSCKADGPEVAWFSSSGIVVGSPGGQIKKLMDDDVAVEPPAWGATMRRDFAGLQQYVSAGEPTGASRGAVGGYFHAEVVRKEIL